MIYLDNSATTQPCEACVRAMTELLTDCWGNPSSVHALGIDAEKRLKAARAQVAQALGAEPERVFFTSGGTEADNWAISGAAERLGKRGRHIVTTAVEHHAVLHPMQRLEARGFEGISDGDAVANYARYIEDLTYGLTVNVKSAAEAMKLDRTYDISTLAISRKGRDFVAVTVDAYENGEFAEKKTFKVKLEDSGEWRLDWPTY